MANKNPSPKTRFKTGQVANPRGAAAHDPIRRELKRLTTTEFRDIIEAALTGNVAALKTIVRNPNETALKVGVAQCLVKAIQKGDWKVVNAICERIVGKLPDKLEVSDRGPRIFLNIPSNGREAPGFELPKIPDDED